MSIALEPRSRQQRLRRWVLSPSDSGVLVPRLSQSDSLLLFIVFNNGVYRVQMGSMVNYSSCSFQIRWLSQTREGISVFEIVRNGTRDRLRNDLTMACQLPKLLVAFLNFMHLIQKP